MSVQPRRALQLVEDDLRGRREASASSRGAAAGRACGPARRAPRRRAGRPRARCAAGAARVAGRVGGRLALAVDGVELLVRVAREDEVVVEQVGVGAVEAEVEHDAGAGRLVAAAALEAARRAAARRAARGGCAPSRSWRPRRPAAPARRRRSRRPATRRRPLGQDAATAASRRGTRRRARAPARAAPRARRGCRRAGYQTPSRGLHVGDAAEHRRRARRATSRRTG